MLHRIAEYSGIDERKLMDLYAESNTDNIEYFFPDEEDKQLALSKVEAGFLDFLRNEFFVHEGNVYYVYEERGVWVSALRLNRIEKGLYYVEALETHPAYRRRGYAVKLYLAIFDELKKDGAFRICSSVHKSNTASVLTHIKSGFRLVPGSAHDYLTGEDFESEFGFEYKYDHELDKILGIRLVPMTRELFHELQMGFEFDPDLFMDMELYEKCRNTKYDAEKVNAHYDSRASAADRMTFAVIHEVYVIGEVVLKHIDIKAAQCELGIHLIYDSVKNKGYGTKAERLAIEYAFDTLGMKRILADSIIKNTRSQHILEKLGFKQTREENGFRYYELERADYFKE